MSRSDTIQKIDEALALLNEAAKESKGNFRGFAEGKYDDLKSALVELGSRTESQARRVMESAKNFSHDAGEQVRNTAASVDRKVHEEPWTTLGWTAGAAFLVGFLLGRRD